jgi:hypothetical protein
MWGGGGDLVAWRRAGGGGRAAMEPVEDLATGAGGRRAGGVGRGHRWRRLSGAGAGVESGARAGARRASEPIEEARGWRSPVE